MHAASPTESALVYTLVLLGIEISVRRDSGVYCAVTDPMPRQAAEYDASAYSALQNSLRIGVTGFQHAPE